MDIIKHVMDEMRSERKILMVLQDKNIDQYVQKEISSLDINDPEVVMDQDLTT